MSFLTKLALTMSYVTCIPVGSKFVGDEEHALDGLAKFLPLVGLIIGMILAFVGFVLDRLHVNSLLGSAILTSSWLWITGGLHMDGLMDTADGIFSHRSKERMLEIMQDSRVGNFAVLAAITAMTLKIFALHSLNLTQGLIALVLIPGWARTCEVYAIGRFQYARPFGKGKVWHDTTVFPRDLFLSALPILLLTVAATFFNMTMALATCLATIAGGAIAAHYLDKKISGHTGDTYGAVVELAEVSGIIVAAIFA